MIVTAQQMLILIDRTRMTLIKRIETDLIVFFIGVHQSNPCHLCSIFLTAK